MAEEISKIYGSMVFNDKVMHDRLPKPVYKSLHETIQNGTALDEDSANAVAHAMKEWAIENGCTHYTHWFQPLSGITSEKHDAFIDPLGDGMAITSFSGKELIQGEPDASSFPSGGLRGTAEARGYTAWDPTSFAFIKDEVLCIPTAFISYTGESLDKKTPLLRSMKAISDQAKRVLSCFGVDDVPQVITTVGAEQEYFLVKEEDYRRRPDLIMCGRTLFGAHPTKGQELEEHYFGAIREVVSDFMKEVDGTLWRMGVDAKTKHNEVAPCQHEIAPIFSRANVAIDNNLLTMEVLREAAPHHGLACLLNEKPFKGINGSGKHNNWSIAAPGLNMLNPGDDPAHNYIFLLSLAAVIQAVDDYQELLRATVASAGNDHRLGANEAPPAIVSIFLGDELTSIVDAIAAGEDAVSHKMGRMDLGSEVLPSLEQDNTDRNRTSPFAFTGNRFELRAVGSSDNCAEAMIVLNTIVADELTAFRERVDARIEAGVRKEKAIYEELKSMIRSSQAIRFDGNGYSEEWRAEAARRGLDCETCAPRVFDRYLDRASIEMFARMGVLSKVELEARTEVKWETYIKKIQIEGRVLGDLTMNHIVPIASRYEALLLDKVYKILQIGQGLDASADIDLIKRIQQHTALIQQLTHDMIEARKVANKIEDQREKALAYHDTVAVYFDQIRKHVDRLEEIVDDQMWPLPKYRELLFIR